MVTHPRTNHFQGKTLCKSRGEILIHGKNVAVGYHNNQVETDLAIKPDHNGKLWFHTGDVGLWDENGCLRIIDRKKDLIKMAQGEYLSLSKVESLLLDSKYVENICVYAGLSASYCIAIVIIISDDRSV